MQKVNKQTNMQKQAPSDVTSGKRANNRQVQRCFAQRLKNTGEQSAWLHPEVTNLFTSTDILYMIFLH